jgi:hypothetical protein
MSSSIYDREAQVLKENEYRFIHLLPGEGDKTIECELFKGPIDKDGKIHYDALSYLWGDPRSRAEITVIDRPIEGTGLSSESTLSVTVNCEIALKHLRLKDKSRTLWVDAICINQENEQEKNAQIPMMRNVYQNADRVLAWLGKGGLDQAHAMKLLQQYQQPTLGEFIWRYLRDCFALAWSILTWQPIYRGRLGQTRLGNREMSAIEDLCNSRYWGRIWMVLELASAKEDPLLGVGDYWVSLKALRNAMVDMARSFITTESDFFAAKQLWIRDKYRDNNGQLGLFEIIHATRNFDCHDERDRIRALLGLVDEKDQEKVNPGGVAGKDYASLLLNVVRYLIQDRKDLRILSRCAFTLCEHTVKRVWKGEEEPTEIEMPTWVPKLYPTLRPSNFWAMNSYDGPYKASGDTSVCADFTEDGRVLNISGLIIDEICDIAGPFAQADDFDSLSVLPIIANLGFRAFRHGFYGNVSHRPTGYQRPGISPADLCDRLLSGAAKEPAVFAHDASPFDERPVDYSFLSQFVQLNRVLFWNKLAARIQELTVLKIRPFELNNNDIATIRGFIVMALKRLLLGRTLFITKSGYIGIGSRSTRRGHLVSIFYGGPVCYILRRGCSHEHDKPHYLFMGDAYLHGFMSGEAINLRNDGGLSDGGEPLRIC